MALGSCLDGLHLAVVASLTQAGHVVFFFCHLGLYFFYLFLCVLPGDCSRVVLGSGSLLAPISKARCWHFAPWLGSVPSDPEAFTFSLNASQG